MKKALKIIICSAFFDSRLVSYREYSYSKGLARLGHDVTLVCGSGGEVWSLKPNGLPVVDPAVNDINFKESTGVKLIRKQNLFRFSDFVFYLPPIKEIFRSDIVHVIEFRTGITVVIAFLAWVFRKPVIYDHEQRGARSTHWYSLLDSYFREVLIKIGARFISLMRHTVDQNLRYFKKCVPSCKVPTFLAPIGCSSEVFYYDVNIRRVNRVNLGIPENEIVVIMTGKLHMQKKVSEVIQAAKNNNVYMILVGDLGAGIQSCIKNIGYEKLIVLPRAAAGDLAGLFSTADIAIFTTFTVSQWEAYSTGATLVIPNSKFSREIFADDMKSAILFGDDSMFKVVDEVYNQEVDLEAILTSALRDACGTVESDSRSSRSRFYSEKVVLDLEDCYRQVLGDDAK